VPQPSPVGLPPGANDFLWGLQIAFAFFYSVFQGYAPDTDLDNVPRSCVGILFGLIVTGLVFRYIWPERTIDRFASPLRQALRQLAKLLDLRRADVSIEKTKTEADALIGEIAKSFGQAPALRRANRVRVRRLASGRSNFVSNFENHAFTYRNVFAAGQVHS